MRLERASLSPSAGNASPDSRTRLVGAILRFLAHQRGSEELSKEDVLDVREVRVTV